MASCIFLYECAFPVKDERAAALGAVQYLMIRIPLGSDDMVLTMMLSHVEQIQRQFLFSAYYGIIAEIQKNNLRYSYCYKLIISFIDLPVNMMYNTYNKY